MTEWAFDAAVAVEPVDGDERRWRGVADARWNVGPVPNGGYLMSLVVSAARRAAAHADPLAVTAYYAARTEPGPVEIDVEPLQPGRRHSTVLARLVQGDRTRIAVSATFFDAGAATGPTMLSEPPAEIPPPEACVPASGPLAPALLAQFDLRLTPETAAWAVGQPSGVPEIAGWARFADGRPADTHSLCVFADVFPPTTFNILPIAWVPTLELTVHVRARPRGEWLRCRFRTRFVTGGYLEEDGELWDEDGRLVAQSRQLALASGPPAPRGAPPAG